MKNVKKLMLSILSIVALYQGQTHGMFRRGFVVPLSTQAATVAGVVRVGAVREFGQQQPVYFGSIQVNPYQYEQSGNWQQIAKKWSWFLPWVVTSGFAGFAYGQRNQLNEANFRIEDYEKNYVDARYSVEHEVDKMLRDDNKFNEFVNVDNKARLEKLIQRVNGKGGFEGMFYDIGHEKLIEKYSSSKVIRVELEKRLELDKTAELFGNSNADKRRKIEALLVKCDELDSILSDNIEYFRQMLELEAEMTRKYVDRTLKPIDIHTAKVEFLRREAEIKERFGK